MAKAKSGAENPTAKTAFGVCNLPGEKVLQRNQQSYSFTIRSLSYSAKESKLNDICSLPQTIRKELNDCNFSLSVVNECAVLGN